MLTCVFRFSLGFTALVAALAFVCETPASAEVSGPILNSLKAMAQAKSYHFSMTTRSSTVEGDFVNPGRYHTKTQGMDMIIIGPTAYMKMGSSGWKKMPGDMSQGMDYIKSLRSTKNFTSTDLGMRTVDGQSLHAYRVVGGKMREPETIYLDGADRIARIDISAGAYMRFTRFDQPISINAPI